MEAGFCTACGKALAAGDQFCAKCGAARERTPAGPVWEGVAYCGACTTHATQRHPGDGTRVCGTCGAVSPEGRTLVGAVPPAHTGRNVVLALLILLLAGAYGYAALGTPADVTAKCGPLYQPCRLTINNHGIWPLQFSGDVTVDGSVVRTSGSGFAGPFGSGTVTLFDTGGAALHSMQHVDYQAGVVLGPTAGSGSLNMRGN